jgi:Protein of unknown function (DUF4239)
MSVQLALIITAVVVAVTAAVVLVLRRLAPPDGFWGRPEPNHSGSAMAVLGSAFAILVAFVMFLAFQSFLNAKRNVDIEATEIEHLFETADLFRAEVRDDLHGTAICYARAVIADEWPKMKHAGRSRLVDHWALALERAVEGADFANPRENQAYSDAAELDRTRQESREERLIEAEPFVPPLLWVALITGGTMLLAYMCSFANRSIRAPLQLILVSAVAMIGTLNLCVVRFLDTPYEDVAGSIKPTRMERSLATMESILAARFPDVRPPCNDAGKPMRPV